MTTTLTNFIEHTTNESIGFMKALSELKIQNDEDAIQAEDILIEISDKIDSGMEYLKGIYNYIATLLSQYEKNVPVPEVTGVELLQFLMEQHSHKQGDLSDVASRTVINEILNGKRNLTLNHIKKLSLKYNIPPELFI